MSENSENDELHPILHGALHLDGSTQSVKQFYADWAKRYDEDCVSWDYSASDNVLQILQSLPESDYLSVDTLNKNISILDAGCGTGMLATVLDSAGYTNINGFDISEDMVSIAAKLQIYKNIDGNVDINEPVQEQWKNKYDCTVSIGVFTPGHVGPEALPQLVSMTKPGG